MALRLRHVPHERRAVRAAGFHLPARARLAEHHTAGIIMAPSLAYMEQAYFDARTHGWSKQPIVELVISSTLDDTLAPQGAARREPVLPARRAGIAGRRSWDDHRETVADLMIDTVDRYAPNFKRSVLGRQICRRSISNAPSGSSAATSSTARSISGRCSRRARCSATRTIAGRCPGLYMCGSGTHPGGGVTGLPGTMRRGSLRDLNADVIPDAEAIRDLSIARL
jgi:phytoene dehydrogenase-like protein